MTSHFIKATLLLSLLAISTRVSAQVENMQWWANYTHTQNVKENWQLSLRSEMRYYDFTENLYRAGISPKIQYAGKNNFKYIIGNRFFHYNTSSRDGIMEYRPWVGINYAHPNIKAVSLSHSTRWEHRFWEDESSEYESRFRYKIKLGTTIFKNEEKSLKIAVASELFWSLDKLDDTTYKNTRVGVPISYQYSKKFAIEVVPFLQTSHSGFTTLQTDKTGVLQLNLKTFL